MQPAHGNVLSVIERAAWAKIELVVREIEREQVTRKKTASNRANR